MIREDQERILDWVGRIIVKRIRKYQSEWIKGKREDYIRLAKGQE